MYVGMYEFVFFFAVLCWSSVQHSTVVSCTTVQWHTRTCSSVDIMTCTVCCCIYRYRQVLTGDVGVCLHRYKKHCVLFFIEVTVRE